MRFQNFLSFQITPLLFLLFPLLLFSSFFFLSLQVMERRAAILVAILSIRNNRTRLFLGILSAKGESILAFTVLFPLRALKLAISVSFDIRLDNRTPPPPLEMIKLPLSLFPSFKKKKKNHPNSTCRKEEVERKKKRGER